MLVNVYQAVQCHSLKNDSPIPNRHTNLKSRADVSIVQGKSDVDWAYSKNSAWKCKPLCNTPNSQKIFKYCRHLLLQIQFISADTTP